jgi:hypothetical protein
MHILNHKVLIPCLHNSYQYSEGLKKKEKAMCEGTYTAAICKFKNLSIDPKKMKTYVYYYDPTNPDQDRCVNGHPLRDIARRCAHIHTPENDRGVHIYVALLKVHGQWKHYVGQAKDWMKRWKKGHHSGIKKGVEFLQKLNLSKLQKATALLWCDIEMGTALLEFKIKGQSDPVIVVYKIKSEIPESDKFKHEQHFINAFRDFHNTQELNDRNACKRGVHDRDNCPFSESDHIESCRECLENSIQT